MTANEKSEVKDCLSCKLTSVVTLLGIGTYFIYQGRKQKSSRHVLYTLGAGNLNNKILILLHINCIKYL